MLENNRPVQDLDEYYKDLMVGTFGEEKYREILEVLDNALNGLCGVEMYYGTFPGLLRTRGVEPKKDYLTEFEGIGAPKEDGEQAATPEQRVLIWNALKDAGFEIK